MTGGDGGNAFMGSMLTMQEAELADTLMTAEDNWP